MCGIAGIFHRDSVKPVDPARVTAMIAPMRHRGPDGDGVWTAPGVGLGHLRLAIIDLAGSPQPMHHAGGALSISFNGEIYNYQALRAELIDLGHRFSTAGDTEVILNAWAQWGPDCLSRLNGMFAFAIHDAANAMLHLARDRFGVKPLHYAELSDGSVIFASELKGLLAHPMLRRDVNRHAIDDFLALGYVPDDACMVMGVRKLAAGHFLSIQRGKALPAETRWWDLRFDRRAKGSEADLSTELLYHLREAVASRMVSDVPLGAFLSGGVDSSAVVAMMAAESKSAVNTCSIGFDVVGVDESSYAEAIAKRFATNHRSRTVASDDYGIIDRVAAHFDEPFADASALPTFRVSELARSHVTVALSGDGADEAFAGYRRHVFHHREEQLRGWMPVGFRRTVLGRLATLYPKLDWAPQVFRAKSTLQSLSQDGAAGYADAVGVTPMAQRAALYAPTMLGALDGYAAEGRYFAAMQSAPADEPIDRAQYADMQIWLPGDILTKVDRMSMAVSLEAREPLLDYRLMQFAASLPAHMRVRGKQGKWLMKKSLETILPHDVLYRPKMGFVTPIDTWFRDGLATEAQRLAQSPVLAQTGWFNMGELARIVAAHQSGQSEYSRQIWQMLMLEKSLVRLFGA
jgi:asparagine synthase (glutamine-hydrolysing)